MEFFPFFVVFLIIVAIGIDEISVLKTLDPQAKFLLLVAPLVMLAALRPVGVGSDDQAYVDIFSRVPNILDCGDPLCDYDYSDVQVEPGFFALLSILGVIGKSATLLFFTISILSITLNLRSIRYFALNSGASVLIYFSHFYLAKEMNAIRTGLATAIVFYAATKLYEKKVITFILLVLVATSIHVTALLSLLPGLIFLLAPRRGTLLVISAIIFVVGALNIFTANIDLGILLGPLQEKLVLYSNAEEYNYSTGVLNAVNIRNMIILAVSLFFWQDLIRFNKSFLISFYFFFSATLIRILLGDFAIVAGRSYAAISMFEYILIPMIFSYFAGQRKGFVLTLIFALLTFSLNLSVNSGWTGGVKYISDFI